MPPNTKKKIEFGDFQTPETLSRSVCQLLRNLRVSPRSVVEPTCGTGSFLRASADAFPDCAPLLGFDVNPDYVQSAGALGKADVRLENFFEIDWQATLNALPEPLLVIGNPPWVTNSTVGALNGTNLPIKSNFQHLRGVEAITGRSNFDISEWMLLHLLKYLSGRSAILAVLCKTVVARRVLQHAWLRNMQIKSSAMYSIDANEYFGASVDACLLVCILEHGLTSRECETYTDLNTTAHSSTFAVRDGRLIADIGAFEMYGHLHGRSPLKWRSGVKHDCSPIMELFPKRKGFENGLGEVIELERTFLYPMLKSSEVANPRSVPSRYMLVTQQSLGEETARIEREAPRTWAYLISHADRLDGRLSSIYRNRPRFSVFGVGPYSFAPWKVAISGFYKRLTFRCIGPYESKPVVLDDTCYFLPCPTKEDAQTLTRLLNSDAAKGFFQSCVFWDAKRPITTQLLASLDLDALSSELGVSLPKLSDESPNLSLFQ